MTRLQQLSLLLLSCCVLFTVLPASAETIHLNQSQFRESFTKDVNISGSVRAGVMYQSDAKRVNPDALYVDVSKESNQVLCVKMISVDGHYGADFEYPLTGKISGLTRFQFTTEHQEAVTGYAPNQIAVLAEIKPACKGKSKNIVPASWGPPVPDSIMVFLNSGISTTYLKVYPLDGGSKKIACQPVKAERGTAYDTECRISDPKHYKLSKTKVIRKNFDNFFKPIKLQIYLTANQP